MITLSLQIKFIHILYICNIFIHIYICIHIYVYTYIYSVYAHTCMYMHLYESIYTHKYVHTYLDLRTQLYLVLYTYSCPISISISRVPSKLKTHSMPICSHETFSWLSHRHLRFSRSKAEPLIYYGSNRFPSISLIFSLNGTTSYSAAQVRNYVSLILSCS